MGMITSDPTPPEDDNLVEMKGMAYYLENGLDPIFLWTEVWRSFFTDNETEDEGDG